MEGLLLAEVVARLRPLLPSRRQAWRFPDAHTFVLPLQRGALWLFSRPPHARIELQEGEPPPAGRAHGPFQELLAARAAGDLESVSQPKLDRVLFLRFAASGGFVERAAVTLVFELTGRNCNLVLVDGDGRIVMAAREVGAEVNRYRQLLPGRPYRPPPPYEKLDPRDAELDELRRRLEGRPLRDLRKQVDGIGPQLTRVLALEADVPVEEPLEGPQLGRALAALDQLRREPSRLLRRWEEGDLQALRRREARDEKAGRLRSALRKELEVTQKRLDDLSRAAEAAAEAGEIRRQADLLLASAHLLEPGSSRAVLDDFEGGTVRLDLDPSLGAAQNAQALYERAKKREARARQAQERRPRLEERLAELQRLLDALPELSDEELDATLERVEPQPAQRGASGPGIRYRGPHGFTVLVGRNARENDEITFRVARSRDLWLHVQGFRGSHVVVLAENREVPFDTVLFAAQLAAAYSKAAESSNVPVDYTLRKHVWKLKGQPPGAVGFTQQKTVYVNPDRHPEAG